MKLTSYLFQLEQNAYLTKPNRKKKSENYECTRHSFSNPIIIHNFSDVTIALNLRYLVSTQILVLHNSQNLLQEIIVTKRTWSTMSLKL